MAAEVVPAGTQTAHAEIRAERGVTWQALLVGWVIGTFALLLLLMSVTGTGTGPGGFIGASSLLWVWAFIAVTVLAWTLLLRALARADAR